MLRTLLTSNWFKYATFPCTGNEFVVIFDAILELVKHGHAISTSNHDGNLAVGPQYINFLRHKSIEVNGKLETPSETFTR